MCFIIWNIIICIHVKYRNVLISWNFYIHMLAGEEAGKILVIANDERTCYQLKEVSMEEFEGLSILILFM